MLRIWRFLPNATATNLQTRKAKFATTRRTSMAVYEFAAELYGIPLEDFARRIEQNFRRFFGPVLE